MARTRMAVVLLVGVTILLAQTRAAAQDLVEVRAADTEYRYVDWSHTFRNGAVLDAFYVGVPGSNEFNVGGGYTLKLGRLNLTPLAYAVVGKEDSQRGVKLAVLATWEQAGWKLLAFAGHYVPLSDLPGRYDVMDTLDLTRVVGSRLEIGVQSGFFRVDGAWNQQTGPLVKLNDQHGAWAASYRFGSEYEFRVGRVLTF